MSRAKGRNTESVSLFSFLAVLVCAMGALIFLLIVTTRRIRSEAVAKAVTPPAVAEEKTEGDIVGLPPWPGTLELGNAQDVPFSFEWPSAAEPEPPRRLAPPPSPDWFLRRPDPPDPNVALREQLGVLLQNRAEGRAELGGLLRDATAAADRARLLAAETKKLRGQIAQALAERQADEQAERDLRSRGRQLLGQLAKTEEQIAVVRERRRGEPTKFAIMPFHGRTGTNMRPVLIELTDAGVRFLPENVLLTPEDFDGFTDSVNPLRAGAEALISHWQQVSRQSDRTDPEPYILLIVRPSGAKFFTARRLLAELGRPMGYELLEEDLPLELPPPDPQAVAACRQAVDALLAERNRLRALLAGEDLEAGRFPGLSGFSRDGKPTAGSPGQVRDRVGLTSQLEGDGSTAPRIPTASTGVTVPNPGRLGGPTHGDRVTDSAISSTGQAGTRTVTTPRLEGSGSTPPWVPPAPTGGAPQVTEQRTGPISSPPQGRQPGSSIEQKASPTDTTADENLAGGKSQNHTSKLEAVPLSSARGTDGQGPITNTDTEPPSLPPHREPPARGDSEVANGTTASEREQPPSAASPREPQMRPLPQHASSGSSGEDALPDFASLYLRRKLSQTLPPRVRWGYSDPRATIGFERPITVDVYNDHLIVGDTFLVRTERAEAVDQVSVWMLEAIERKVRSWGWPPSSFYWVPTLKFRVAAGAEPLYRQLDRTADDWGLQRKVERLAGAQP